MLATKYFVETMASVADKTQGLTIPRKAGVLKQLVIPADLCRTSEYLTTSLYDAASASINLCKGATIQALTNVFGVRGECKVNVMLIDTNLAVVELTEGSIYMVNDKNCTFGYNTDGQLLKHNDKIHWMKISDLYTYLLESVMRKFNVSDREAIDYLYNAEFSVELSYTENPPSKVALSHCYSDFRYKLADMNGTLACGQFDFIVFEKEAEEPEYNIYDKWNRRGRRKKSVDEDTESYTEKSEDEAYEELADQYDSDCDDAYEEVERDPDDDDFSDWDEEYGADDTDGYYDD